MHGGEKYFEVTYSAYGTKAALFADCIRVKQEGRAEEGRQRLHAGEDESINQLFDRCANAPSLLR